MRAGQTRDRRHLRRLAVTAIAAGVLLALTIDLVRRLSELAVGDFETYWGGSRRLLDGAVLYPASQLGGPFILGDAAFGRGYVYPPTAALLATPLATVPMEIAFGLFTIVSLGALAFVAYRIGRREGLGAVGAGLLALLLVATGPGFDALLTGNVNALAAAGVGAMWLWPSASGYVAVLGGLVKVYPGVGLIWTIRKRAPLVGPIVLGLGLVAVSLVILGLGAWRDFQVTMANGLSTEYFVIQSPRSLLTGALGSTVALAVALGLTLLAVLGALRVREDAVALVLVSLAMILPAPDWHLHYFIVPLVGSLPLLIRAWLGAAPARRPAGDPGVAAPVPPG